MTSRCASRSILLAMVFAALLLESQIVEAVAKSHTSEAYVTLLYGDEFLLGVRVLGKSIRGTGSNRDMVVLVSEGVSDYAKNLLQADVVYLDADTIVVKNIDDLFKCGKFCANLKHSERLNSGVMVVEPSESLFEDMMSKVKTLQSYTGDIRNSKPIPEMERLSTLYNADVGLYMLASKWMVDEKELRVIHYTLGPLKPWDWWTAWLLKPVDIWQTVREQLEESLPGTGGGKNPNEDLLVKFLFILPLCVLLFCYYKSFLQMQKDIFSLFFRGSFFDNVRRLYYKVRAGSGLTYNVVGVSSSSAIDSHQQFSYGSQSKLPSHLGGVSIVICFMAAIVSLALSFAIVPRQVMPWTGLLLMYEWTFTVFFFTFRGYLKFVQRWGKATGSFSSDSDSLDDNSGKGHLRQVSTCDISAWYYGLGMAFLAVVAPSLPCLFGITALFLR
ncbi:hypothetical protein Syun_002055 [Stephania yunnanensis]|uniref:Hexosyltransferase n=1 Tax=Stephania yunnanensis TaxID=152371 RepID=A0AAP0Q729_9MAGN